MTLIIILLLILVSLLIDELLKKLEFKDRIFVSIELSIIALALIASGAPEDSNFFFCIEFSGFLLLFIGAFIFTLSLKRKYKK